MSNMEKLIIRPMETAAEAGEFLGMCIVEGRAFFFGRKEELEVALVASPGEPGVKYFKVGRSLGFEYRSHPRDARELAIGRFAERFVSGLAKREGQIVQALEREESEGRFLFDGRSGPAELVSFMERDDHMVFRLALSPRERVVRITVGDRGRYPLPLFAWSAAVEIEGGDASPDEQMVLQQFLLVLVARFMSGLAPPGQEEVERRQEASGPAYLYFDLTKPEFNEDALKRAVALDGQNLVLSLDVPSRCDNRCVFCAPSEGMGEAAGDCEGVLEELQHVLEGLSEVFERTGRVDANLVGLDVFNFQGLEELLRQLRGTGRVTMVTAVSPGTRLKELEFVRRLKAGGLDSVTLTLLGPRADLHDAMAGRHGAFDDLIASIANLKKVGLDWELNTVVVKGNLESLPKTVLKSVELGSRARIYVYTSEPFVSRELAEQCYPRYTDLASVLERAGEGAASNILSIHYVPLCVLPVWARTLAGHSSQRYPDAPEEPPPACRKCSKYLAGCNSVTAHYLDIYGDDELKTL